MPPAALEHRGWTTTVKMKVTLKKNISGAKGMLINGQKGKNTRNLHIACKSEPPLWGGSFVWDMVPDWGSYCSVS